MRMPAIQTLVLFANTIVTNSTLTKFVFDDFLLIHVPLFGQGKFIISRLVHLLTVIFILGKSLLLKSISLRDVWKTLSEKKLNKDELNKDEVFCFKKDLINFMNTEISYNIHRLLPADLKTIFSDVFEFDILENKIKNPFDEKFVISKNEKIGGINVTDYIVYNGVAPEEWDYVIEKGIIETPLVCQSCQSIMENCMLKVFYHEKFCLMENKIQESTVIEKTVSAKANSKLFHCDICQSDLYLTPIEILKHKKIHTAPN